MPLLVCQLVLDDIVQQIKNFNLHVASTDQELAAGGTASDAHNIYKTQL